MQTNLKAFNLFVEFEFEGLRVRIKITNKINPKNYFRLCHIFIIDLLFFILYIYIIPSGRQKYGLIGNFKSFKIMSLHQTDIQTQRRKKKFDFSLFFFISFNRLNITRSGRQNHFDSVLEEENYSSRDGHFRRVRRISPLEEDAFSFVLS